MKVYLPIVIEEFDGDKYIELQAGFEVTPGEPMVRYYPDGSGYPGSPPEVELVDVHILSIEGAEGILPLGTIKRSDVYDYLRDNEDLWFEEALEHAQARYEDY